MLYVSESLSRRQRNTTPGFRMPRHARNAHPASTFDMVTFTNVLHHIDPEPWQSVILELRRVIRPEALVTIIEHNPFNPLTRRAVSNCPFDEDAVLLSKRTATGYFARAGLNDVQGKYILTIPSVRGFLRTADDSLGFIPIGAQYYIVGRR